MKHPGKTPAQRRALDQIGAGNYSPIMSDRTRDSMLGAGLIEELTPIIIQGVRVRQFQMPIPVHMQWCSWCAEQP